MNRYNNIINVIRLTNDEKKTKTLFKYFSNNNKLTSLKCEWLNIKKYELYVPDTSKGLFYNAKIVEYGTNHIINHSYNNKDNKDYNYNYNNEENTILSNNIDKNNSKTKSNPISNTKSNQIQRISEIRVWTKTLKDRKNDMENMKNMPPSRAEQIIRKILFWVIAIPVAIPVIYTLSRTPPILILLISML